MPVGLDDVGVTGTLVNSRHKGWSRLKHNLNGSGRMGNRKMDNSFEGF